MYLTGYTSNRLQEVKTLDKNNPYKVGVNGVFNVQPSYIEYEIEGIFYKTFLNGNSGIPNDRTPSRKIYTYTTPIELSQPNRRLGKSTRDTIFKVKLTNNNFNLYPLLKEENKLEQVFLPEIEDEIFIERGVSNIYEKHMRLMDINNIGQLEIYKNGFFNLKKV
jgi:hypothetical protein